MLLDIFDDNAAAAHNEAKLVVGTDTDTDIETGTDVREASNGHGGGLPAVDIDVALDLTQPEERSGDSHNDGEVETASKGDPREELQQQQQQPDKDTAGTSIELNSSTEKPIVLPIVVLPKGQPISSSKEKDDNEGSGSGNPENLRSALAPVQHSDGTVDGTGVVSNIGGSDDELPPEPGGSPKTETDSKSGGLSPHDKTVANVGVSILDLEFDSTKPHNNEQPGQAGGGEIRLGVGIEDSALKSFVQIRKGMGDMAMGIRVSCIKDASGQVTVVVESSCSPAEANLECSTCAKTRTHASPVGCTLLSARVVSLFVLAL